MNKVLLRTSRLMLEITRWKGFSGTSYSCFKIYYLDRWPTDCDNEGCPVIVLLHINTPISGLITIFIRCGMCWVFA